MKKYWNDKTTLNVSFRTTSAICRISSEHDEKYTVKDGNQIQTRIPATVTRKEKSLEERLISGGDKHLSWRKGREEKTFSMCRESKSNLSAKSGTACLGAMLARSCSGVNSLRYCFNNKSEAGLPIRRVLFQSPWRPMSENIERNLPILWINGGVGHWQWALARERTLLTKMWTSYVMDLGFNFWVLENQKAANI